MDPEEVGGMELYESPSRRKPEVNLPLFQSQIERINERIK